MSTIAPPRPPPQEDLEALIKEARRRARRRRLIYAAVAALLLATGGGVYAIVALMGGGGSPASVPEGFHLVKAKGPVAHARIEQYTRSRPTVIDLASGTERRVSFVLEEWWDERTGLDRVVLRNEGRVQADVVGQSCQPKPRFCFPLPPPFDLGRYGLRWPVDEKRFRVLGRGRFRGHDVIWVKSLVSNVGVQKGDRLAYGAVTHELVAKRSAFGPTEEVYTLLPDLPAASVSRSSCPRAGARSTPFRRRPRPTRRAARRACARRGMRSAPCRSGSARASKARSSSRSRWGRKA